MKTEFNEDEAIRLTSIARPSVKNDPISMFASDEDLLIYEHFFINGMQHSKQVINDLLKIIDNNVSYLTDSQIQSVKKARNH